MRKDYSKRYIDADFNYRGVEYFHDVEYVRRGDIVRTMQILKPLDADPKAKYPLVVYIQGSAFRAQEMYRWLPQLAQFARRGFVVASVQYRGSDLARFPAPIEDAKAGLRYICAHADEYQADAENVFIWGDSSGGMTALLVGFTDGLDVLDAGDYADTKVSLKGIIDWYGAVDQLAMLHEESGKVDPEIVSICEGQFGKDAEKNCPELIASGNPIRYISKNREIPPVLMFHGDADVTVPYTQSVLLFDALTEAEKDVTFYTVKGAMHGGAPFHSPSVTDIMEKFIRDHCV